ncbi:MAG: hypothetical protein J6J38_05450 [Lachnospiraceae bacterium]|nr:hypothetical protein [Lachnospiraceae bacterium]
MMKEEIQKKVLEIMNNNGIFIASLEDESEDKVDVDSLSYISIMVDMECEFDIAIPEKYFSSTPETYCEFVKMLCDIAIECKYPELINA